MSGFDIDIFGEDEWFSTRPMWDHVHCCLEPLTEVSETHESLVVTADLPFAKKDSIKIDASEDNITIEAETYRKIRFKRWGTFQSETEFQYYRTTLPLPKRVDPTKAKAIYKNGMLKVILPKVARLHRIRID